MNNETMETLIVEMDAVQIELQNTAQMELSITIMNSETTVTLTVEMAEVHHAFSNIVAMV